MVEPIKTVSMQLQVWYRFWSVALNFMVRVVSWIFGERRKDGFIVGTVTIVGRRLYWIILNTVVLRVANWLCLRFGAWWYAGSVWMIRSYQQAARSLAFIRSSMKDRP